MNKVIKFIFFFACGTNMLIVGNNPFEQLVAVGSQSRVEVLRATHPHLVQQCINELYKTHVHVMRIRQMIPCIAMETIVAFLTAFATKSISGYKRFIWIFLPTLTTGIASLLFSKESNENVILENILAQYKQQAKLNE